MSAADGRRLDRHLAVKAAEALLPGTVGKEFLSTLRALPVQVHTHGLAAACAYLLSRASSAAAGPEGQDRRGQDRYTRAVNAVLRDAAEFVGITPGTLSALQLLERLIENEQRYRIAERRARLFAVWLARLAAAIHAQQTEESTQRDVETTSRVGEPAEHPGVTG